MKATKGNKVYTIDEASKNRYKAEGFDIYDDDGNLLEYGRGKMIAFEQYEAVKKELDELKASSPTDDQDVIEILKSYANEHEIALGNTNKVTTIVKKIKEHQVAESGE